jgi:hypothetical protein
MLVVSKLEYAPQPVNLIIPRTNLGDLLPYNCIRCKSYIFSINRDVAAIWMGAPYPAKEIPNGMGWVKFYCQGCHRDYNFYFQ